MTIIIVFVLFVIMLIIDGWSDASFNTELNNIYLSLKSNPNYKPVQLKSSYKDFVIEQIAAGRNNDIIEFWKTELSGYSRFSFTSKDKKSEEWKIIKNFDNEIHAKLIAKAKELRRQHEKYLFYSIFICS